MPSNANANSPSWQSTIIALALIALAGGIFIVVFEKEGTSSALKVWAALGTIVGVLAGAIPTYFFGQQTVAAAKEGTKVAKDAADAAKEESERAHQAAAKDRANRELAEKQARVVLSVADPNTIQKALAIDEDLLGKD
jgi:Na+/glutamate symporter